MTTLSSHVLDSVIGTHASGIRVECFQRMPSGEQHPVFDVIASSEGRISEAVELKQTGETAEIELVFHSNNYFATMQLPDDGFQVMEVVVVRLKVPDPEAKYHVPVMLSPHSYSIWWSGSGKRPKA